MKTHIVEQDRNGFITPVKYVWLVRQTEPENDFQNETIGVFTDEQTAINLARKLNQKYGENCVFDNNWDFVEFNYDGDPIYYDVDRQKINPNTKEYL